jgi:UDP-N-acetylmuramoyl-tripeptide--D-alanyl-D-alanine ligase
MLLKLVLQVLIIENAKRDLLKKLDARLLEKILVAAVPNPLDALYKLAAARRAKFHTPIIAVTGSIGKTSTKEILAHIVKLNGKNVWHRMQIKIQSWA